MSLDCFDFINGCLKFDIKERYSPEEVINHKFIKEADLSQKIKHDRGVQHRIKLSLQNEGANNNSYGFLNSENAIYVNTKKADYF